MNTNKVNLKYLQKKTTIREENHILHSINFDKTILNVFLLVSTY